MGNRAIEHTHNRAAAGTRILALGALLIVLGLLAWRLSDVVVLIVLIEKLYVEAVLEVKPPAR
ncbi:MAG: hypothetical protein U1D25_12370 [Hydrogenophaga sp.]|uniref:hypothetical protein n=1 Tax=Hydrogenophaga sp. TaxID=1904254 RepID=UPI002ABB566E|nr:hypothetical protein [Hydrogenophaga sp.]MDZ4188886.1 hypothetical protein [Hydrogenophaga sp.]